MRLRLGQLVYTSFTEMGFRAFTSAQVSREIQQAFIQSVVSRHWDTYNPPRSGYRAVYLHQVSLEKTLFGWLYNDESDDMGDSPVPYYICYYLAEPLLDFQLENIFTCLRTGPVTIIPRHSPPAVQETKVLPDLGSYKPARPGVAVPSNARARSHISLQQGELLNLFIPINQQETIIELSEQTYEQHKANLSVYTTYLIEGIETGAAVNENSAAINPGAIELYRGNKSAGAITNKHLTPVKVSNKSIEVHEGNILSLMGTALTSFNISPQESFYHTAIIAYKNSQLLLKIGITATVLALTSSIYGLLQTSIFAPNNPQLTSYASNPVFYKTLAEVPNVPQGLFKYGGSTTFAPLRATAIVSALKQAHPKFQLSYAKPIESSPGSGTGIKMLLAGELNFAQSSRSVKDSELSEAKTRGFTIEKIPVAIDGIAFYVNSQVSIPGLSLSQLRDIFIGKITNWKALGGPDMQIVPFSRNLRFSGTAELLKEKVLAGEELSRTVQEVETTTESIRKVATTPGGISYATASEVIRQNTIHALPLSEEASQAFVSPFADPKKTGVNKTAFANGSYPLTRRLFVIIKRDGTIDEQAGTAYANLFLSDEGQRLVEKAGFAPIR